MATTIKTANETHCGFSTHISFLNLGNAINEGYTEIMTNRYFNYKLDYSGYTEQIIICKELEDIVGKEKMEQLYMEANLNGLIIELSKYAKQEDIFNFIKNTDEILEVSDILEYNDLQETITNKIKDKITEKRIQVNLFLDTLKMRKQQKNNQLKITNQDYKSTYTINDKNYKKVFLA